MPSLPKLPPGADVVFRRLFNEEDGCRLLISLLNAILGYPPGRRIRKLTFLPRHVAGPVADDKEVIVDIRAEAEDGRHFHVEVQVCSQPTYAERMLFYWAEMYGGQLEVGKGYGDLHAVVSVHFLFFRLLPEPAHAAYHHVFRVRADSDGALLSPHFEMHTVEMTKFPDLKAGAEEVKWVYWLKHGQEMTEQEVAALGVPEIMEAERRLEMISQDRSLRVAYEQRMKALRDAAALKRDSWLEGEREGERKGERKGERIVRQAILGLCQALGVGVSAEQRTRMESLPLEKLEILLQYLQQHRTWPED